MRHLDFDVVCGLWFNIDYYSYIHRLSFCCHVLLKIPSEPEHTYFSFTLSLPDPAYDFGKGAYQEMKAEVTEVAASRLIPEGNHNFTGKFWVLLMPM